jgi:SNF family Na+-dependent transporter
MLNRSDLAETSGLGPIQSHVVLALAIAWIITFLCVFNGINSIGWAVYVTSTVPYLLLIILLMRGLSLPGADIGIEYLFRPNLTRLWSTEV